MIISPGANLQRAVDDAWKARDVLVLRPGYYPLFEKLRARCSLRGVGFCKLEWVGKDDGDWMVEVVGTPGELESPDVSGLSFFGGNKVGGLSVDNVHYATAHDLQFYHTLGGGMTIRSGWYFNVQDVRALECRGQVFDFQSLNLGSVTNLGLVECRSDSWLARINGMADVRNVAIEDCAAKEVAFDLPGFFEGSLAGFSTERLDTPVIVRVSDAFGPCLERFNHSQEDNHPGKVAVLFERCRAPRIHTLNARNFSDCLVWFHDCAGRHDAIYEYYRLNGFSGYGVQPKDIVREDYSGQRLLTLEQITPQKGTA